MQLEGEVKYGEEMALTAVKYLAGHVNGQQSKGNWTIEQ